MTGARFARATTVIVLLAAIAAQGAIAGARGHGGEGLVAAAGTVGPLTIDRSNGAAVKAFAGRPDYVGAGRFRPLFPNFVAFIAYGYNCRHVAKGGLPTMASDPSTGAAGDSHIACQTVYFLRKATGLLAAFTTDSPAFRTPAGTRVGMAFSAAENRELEHVNLEQPPGIQESSSRADLTIYQNNAGNRVARLELDSNHHPTGIGFV